MLEWFKIWSTNIFFFFGVHSEQKRTWENTKIKLGIKKKKKKTSSSDLSNTFWIDFSPIGFDFYNAKAVEACIQIQYKIIIRLFDDTLRGRIGSNKTVIKIKWFTFKRKCSRIRSVNIILIYIHLFICYKFLSSNLAHVIRFFSF